MDKQTAEKLKIAIAIIRNYCSRKTSCINCMFFTEQDGDTLCKLLNYYPEQWKDEWLEVDEDAE